MVAECDLRATFYTPAERPLHYPRAKISVSCKENGFWPIQHEFHVIYGEDMTKRSLVPIERIEQKIYFIRGQKVMLDSDLALLYGVPTKVLKQAVNRNSLRFPKDFMFQLSRKELENWRSQFVTSNSGAKMGLRWRPYVFTEQGVAMLSSVLRSPRAISVNIEIMRAFVRLRQLLSSHADLVKKLNELEAKYDEQFRVVFEAIRALMESPEPEKKGPIGFRLD